MAIYAHVYDAFLGLRLYPPVPVNFRTALRDTVLPTGGGPDGKSPIIVLKGKTVAFCPYALHRRPDLYGIDAASFQPERWDEDMPLLFDSINAKWGYIPFGAGPRTCLGSESMLLQCWGRSMLTQIAIVDFALTEAAYTVVRLLQELPRIQLPDSETAKYPGAEEQDMTLVLAIGKGCKVSIL
jgi:hypothetical protein